MELKMKLVCLLVLYFTQLCVPVQSACPTDCVTNGGTCDGSLSCLCASGDGGVACIDDCDSTCTACDGTAVGECLTCTGCSAYGLSFCQTKDDDTARTAVCACKTGFTDTLCDKCDDDANGCSGEGTCGTVAPNVGVCACDATHAGTFCQHACPATPCTAPQICVVNAGDTAAVCGCETAGLSGAACTTVTCSPDDPCENGATCNTDRCDCAANYAGLTCQHKCTDPCAEGKTCEEKDDGTGAECSGTSMLLASWIVFIVVACSTIKLY